MTTELAQEEAAVIGGVPVVVFMSDASSTLTARFGSWSMADSHSAFNLPYDPCFAEMSRFLEEVFDWFPDAQERAFQMGFNTGDPCTLIDSTRRIILQDSERTPENLPSKTRAEQL
jgi:hypothetical protein